MHTAIRAALRCACSPTRLLAPVLQFSRSGLVKAKAIHAVGIRLGATPYSQTFFFFFFWPSASPLGLRPPKSGRSTPNSPISMCACIAGSNLVRRTLGPGKRNHRPLRQLRARSPPCSAWSACSPAGPVLSLTSTLAPFPTSSLTTSVWPLSAARYSGVIPRRADL